MFTQRGPKATSHQLSRSAAGTRVWMAPKVSLLMPPATFTWLTPNADSITEYAAQSSGNVSPIATISGSATGLNEPVGLAVDSQGNIYASNFNYPNFSVTVYSAGSNGNVAPAATIAGPATSLVYPEGVALDPIGNVYASNLNDFQTFVLTVFPPNSNGNATPSRVIQGVAPHLSFPVGLIADSKGRVIVANTGSSTLAEYGAKAKGSALPFAVIGGNKTGLVDPLFVAAAPGKSKPKIKAAF